jgi:hypothetical protein
MQMKPRTATVVAAFTGLIAGPFLSAVVAAGPVAVSTVAVFSNGDYTDVGEEDANLIDDLEARGHTVVLIEELSAEAFTTGLDGAHVLAIPEIDSLAFLDDASADVLDVIRAFVDGGGRILFFGSNDPTPLMNELFEYELEYLDEFCFPPPAEGVSTAAVGDCVLTAAAADTEMADGPADLAYVNDSTSVTPASLPEGSTVFYEGTAGLGPNAAGAAGVLPEDLVAAASMPFGDGAVLLFGWDWFPDTESDSTAAGVAEEAEWATVLDLSVSQPEVSASSPAAGALDLTMDSPSTQPVFVALVINGTPHTVVIAAKTTSASFDVGGQATVAWSVPGWGIGEGSVDVAGATAAPPAEPAPVAPTFTG